jgi:hypothetical protein
MATVLQGVMTDKGRELLAKSFGNAGGFALVSAVSFGYGEGGFTISGTGKVPKTPDPTKLDLEARTLNVGTEDDFVFGHNFGPTDVTFIAPSTIELRCKLVPSESNDDGHGNLPKFFELGIFDGPVVNNKPTGNMLAYTTFDEQTKSSTKSLVSYIQVVF